MGTAIEAYKKKMAQKAEQYASADICRAPRVVPPNAK